jgi:serine/threonine-protein kinase
MLGRTILHYRIIERLGAGGMGEIYKAQDTRLNRLVAIKVLSGANSGDPDSRRRFIQEAQAASTLNHPNIITIYDILTEDDHQFMVMEFVNGKTVAELLNTGPFTPADTLLYAVQIADALATAHAAGIVHRDLKPGNLMITPQGRVKILDFGLAKLTMPTGPVSLSDKTLSVGPAPMTQQGSIVGTVSYMSPEQAQAAHVDARSDIFSFGSVVYEMLTGKRAFPGDTPLLILTGILRDEPRPIAVIAPTVPAQFVAIVDRALRKDPAARWQSMQEMHDELTGLKQRLDSGILPAPELPEAAAPRRWPVVAALVAAVCLAFAGSLWWWGSHGVPIPSAAPPVAAKAATTTEVKPSSMSPAILDNNGVLEMVQAKVPVDVIIGHIRSSPTNFNLSTSEVIRLAKGGVTELILQAMRDPKAAKPPEGVRPDAAAPASEQARTVRIIGGEPLPIILTEDVSADCEQGQPLHFRTANEISSGGVVVVPKGAPVTGVVVEPAHRKFLVSKARPTFRLIDVVAVDGTRLKVRATPGKLGESRKDPPLEPVGAKTKDAPAGSHFVAYFDGDQTLALKPKEPSNP